MARFSSAVMVSSSGGSFWAPAGMPVAACRLGSVKLDRLKARSNAPLPVTLRIEGLPGRDRRETASTVDLMVVRRRKAVENHFFRLLSQIVSRDRGNRMRFGGDGVRMRLPVVFLVLLFAVGLAGGSPL